MKRNRGKQRAMRMTLVGSGVLALATSSVIPPSGRASADGMHARTDTHFVTTAAAADQSHAASTGTATPINHLVVVFQENSSFDHYFRNLPTMTHDGDLRSRW